MDTAHGHLSPSQLCDGGHGGAGARGHDGRRQNGFSCFRPSCHNQRGLCCRTVVLLLRRHHHSPGDLLDMGTLTTSNLFPEVGLRTGPGSQCSMSLLGDADADDPQTHFEELATESSGAESGSAGQTGAYGTTSSPRDTAKPSLLLSAAWQSRPTASWIQVLGWGVWHLRVTQEDGEHQTKPCWVCPPPGAPEPHNHRHQCSHAREASQSSLIPAHESGTQGGFETPLHTPPAALRKRAPHLQTWQHPKRRGGFPGLCRPGWSCRPRAKERRGEGGLSKPRAPHRHH